MIAIAYWIISNNRTPIDISPSLSDLIFIVLVPLLAAVIVWGSNK